MSGAWVAGALAAARDGDEQAFVRLWTDANPGVVRYLCVAAAGRVDELALLTWAELTRKLRRFRGDEAAWRRLVFTTARACARQQDARAAEDTPGAPPGFAADDTLDSILTRVALDLVAVLPEHQGEVIVLRTAGRLDVADVAKVLKLSEPTVRTAAHAGLARAGALAADDAARGLIDSGAPVEDPPGWERTGYVAGLGTVESAFEDLLAGRSVTPGAPARTRLVAALLAALRAPASPAELRGLDAARTAYERQFADVPRHAAGMARLGSRAAVGAAAAMIGLSGTAFAAYAGILPAPLQDVAHNWFNAPAHAPGKDVPGVPQQSTPSTGATTMPGPGVTSSPVPGSARTPHGAPATSPGALATTPPGSTKTPPGSTNTPPGSTNTPPGSTKTPPGSTNTPPGSTNTPPGSTNTPPGSTKTPPGSTKTPPGSTKTASASNTPPGSTKTPPGSTKTASASNTPPGSTSTPPASTKTPPGSTNTPPASTRTPHGGGTGQSR